MKIWFPVSLSESGRESPTDYFLSCCLYLSRFKTILRSNILIVKWQVLDEKLKESDLLEDATEKFKATNIPNQFINNLNCGYDGYTEKCYYYVSNLVKCFGTSNNLNKLIDLCEFGNDDIPPINWIRHSYLLFKDAVKEDFVT